MIKNKKVFSVRRILILVLLLIVSISSGWLIYKYQPSSPLSESKLKSFNADEVNSKSQMSERQMREEIDKLSLVSFGLKKEGEAYSDYCGQHNESGTASAYYVVECSQQLVLYLSSINDIDVVNTDLTNVFQQKTRFILTNPKIGACLKGQITMLRDAEVTYSRSKDLAIDNQISGHFAVSPADKSKWDNDCRSPIWDISSSYYYESGYFIKSTKFSEDDLYKSLLNKNAQSTVIFVFSRTYFKETI